MILLSADIHLNHFSKVFKLSQRYTVMLKILCVFQRQTFYSIVPTDTNMFTIGGIRLKMKTVLLILDPTHHLPVTLLMELIAA